MAVIQKIRDKYAKLAGGLIALALIAFIVTSASESNIGNSIKEIFGGKASYVAKVDGSKIEQNDYAKRLAAYDVLYEVFAPDRKLNDADRAQMHEQALREMVYEKLVAKQMDALGIVVTKEEENDAIKGPEPDQLIRQFPYFLDPKTKQFDPQAVTAFETRKGMDMSDSRVQKALEQWEVVKEYVKRNHRIQKFNNMVMNGVYAPKIFADRAAKDQVTFASIRYVKVPFATINDNDPGVKTTDADLEDYINRHQAQYKVEEPTRTFDYVAFDEKPSGADTAKNKDALTTLKAEFATRTDMEAFVGRNSSEPYGDKFVTKKSFASQFADTILGLPVGSVYGPYFENDAYKLVKVVAKATMPDSVKAQHILFAPKEGRDDSTCHRMADSVLLLVKGGANFDSLAAHMSDDEGSKVKGGDLGYFGYGAMVPEFNQFCFDGKPGEMKVLKTQFGYHVVKINDQKDFEPATKLAIVVKPLLISPETDQDIFNRASRFAAEHSSASAYDDAVKKDKLNKVSSPAFKVNDFTIPGIGASREVIRWAYNAKLGDVSGIFKLDTRYIVAKLTGIQEKGLQKVDDKNRPQLESLVKAEKKAKILKEKYKSMTTLESIAQASGQQIMTADSFNADNSFLPNLGPAPKVIGYSFYSGFKPNTVSPALKGGDGMFFIMVTNRFEKPMAPNDPMTAQRAQAENQAKNAVGGGMLESIRKNADIKYNGDMIY